MCWLTLIDDEVTEDKKVRDYAFEKESECKTGVIARSETTKQSGLRFGRLLRAYALAMTFAFFFKCVIPEKYTRQQG
jgi:hypothetical protein